MDHQTLTPTLSLEGRGSQIATSENAVHTDRQAATDAVHAARAWWLVFLATPVAALAMGWLVLDHQPSSQSLALVAAALAMAWLAVAGSGMLVLRGHCFRAAWQGRPISPQRYLRGVLWVWGAIEAAALLGVLGCLVGGAVLPGAVPVALSLTLLALLPPSARAVAR